MKESEDLGRIKIKLFGLMNVLEENQFKINDCINYIDNILNCSQNFDRNDMKLRISLEEIIRKFIPSQSIIMKELYESFKRIYEKNTSIRS